MGLSIDEIKELARYPRQVPSGNGSPRPVDALVGLKDSTTNVTLKDSSFDYAGAMRGTSEGHRNTTLHKLISSDRAHDLPREAAEVHALTFADRCNPQMDHDEALQVVESVYSTYPPGRNGEVYPYLYPIGEVRQVHPKLERFSDIPPPQGFREHVVEGMAIKGHPFAMFGDGGVAKSTLGIDLGQRVARGEPWMGRGTVMMPVMLLDFELDSSEQHRRAYEIAAGQGYNKPPENFYYMCAAGLSTKEVFRFALEQCKELGIGLIIVDSLGVALEGDAESSKDVLSFFRNVEGAFRREGITLLIVDHQSKLQAGERYQNKTMFGSVYKSNMVRSVFQVEAKDREEGSISLVVRHKKMNFGPMIDPFGVHITFEYGKTTVEHEELAPEDLATEGSLNAKDQVLHALKEGPAYPSDLIDRTGLEKQTIKNALTKLRKEGKIEDTGNERNQAREVQLKGVPSVPTTKGTGTGTLSLADHHADTPSYGHELEPAADLPPKDDEWWEASTRAEPHFCYTCGIDTDWIVRAHWTEDHWETQRECEQCGELEQESLTEEELAEMFWATDWEHVDDPVYLF